VVERVAEEVEVAPTIVVYRAGLRSGLEQQFGHARLTVQHGEPERVDSEVRVPRVHWGGLHGVDQLARRMHVALLRVTPEVAAEAVVLPD
jgi:hypothetical protein